MRLGKLILAIIAAACAGSVAMASMAKAQENPVRDTITISEFEKMLEASGLRPDEVMTDRATGAPVATAVAYDPQLGSTVFVVRAMDCKGRPSACGQILLFANFDLQRDVTDEDFRIVNSFNDRSMHGRAFVLEDRQQIGVDLRIDMIGGVTDDHIDGRIQRWIGVISDFRKEMRKAHKGS